jgi:hypothetical protein
VEAVRFELTDPFEPSVFKTGAINRTLPHFHIGVGSQIRTGGFTVLQTVALGHSAIPTSIGGGNRTRTCHLMLAKHLLYQMSYTPKYKTGYI